MKPPSKEQPRDRVLTDDELRWLWRACEAVGWPFGPLVKLLLLTAQRRDEVAGMERPEIDLEKGIWTMPREKAKNNRAHEVQLSAAALKVLNHFRRSAIGSCSRAPVDAGVRLLARQAAARRRDARGQARRARRGSRADPALDFARSAPHGGHRHGAAEFPPHVVDKVLNHVSGTIRGVAAVYNRFEYLEERRAALEAWGRYVENLVSPVPANVVALRG